MCNKVPDRATRSTRTAGIPQTHCKAGGGGATFPVVLKIKGPLYRNPRGPNPSKHYQTPSNPPQKNEITQNPHKNHPTGCFGESLGEFGCAL